MKTVTPKQVEILKLIIRANSDGSLIDLDQLLERASYKPTKQSIQFTIRQLVEKRYIEKRNPVVRRGSLRIVYSPTMQGIAVSTGLKI